MNTSVFKKVKMTSTFMRTHQGGLQSSYTAMSTYGIKYFNDNYSSGDCSDGYQSSISPAASPALGPFKHDTVYGNDTFASSYSPKANYSYQNTSNYTSSSCSYRTHSNEINYSESSYKVNVQIKPFRNTNVLDAIQKTVEPVKLAKVNRFVEQFNQQRQNIMEQKDLQTSPEQNPPPEILKKRRVAANARERRRMNNLNFAFDR